MLRIFADNHDLAVTLDYLALFAYFLYGRSNFHFGSSFPIISFARLYGPS